MADGSASFEPLPKFAWYLAGRRLKIRAYKRLLGFDVSHEQLRRVALPFGAAGRRQPSDELKAAIAAESGGFVGVDDWDAPFIPPELAG